jgi:hypothetical protein
LHQGRKEFLAHPFTLFHDSGVVMPQFPTRKGDGKPSERSSGDGFSRLFSTGKHPTLGTDPVAAALRSERGMRIASEIKRGLFLAMILFGVAIVLALFVSELSPRP